MSSWQTATWRAASIGRWMALLAGTLMVLLFLVFLVGEGPPRLSALTATEKLQFLAMSALFFGLLAAWKWEGAGGLLALAGFAALVAIGTNHMKLWAFDIPAAIAVIHLACWWRLRAGAPAGLAPWHLSRYLLAGIGGLLAVFLLLCANEMFGQPPLMTPALRPGTDLLGAWTQTTPVAVALIVHPDATVTGTIDSTDVSTAHIAFGRSWFGKLLHWNADFVIRGRVANRDFAAPMIATRHGLDGSLFRDNRPVRLNLRKL
jgi:hypothetical protein